MAKRVFLTMMLSVFVATMALAEPAITVKTTIVRLAPESQSTQVTELTAGQKVELQGRQGGWYQVVLSDGRTGWLPLLSIRKEGAGSPKKAKTGGLKNLLSSFRTGSSGVTVATGVRGLDAVDLKNSKPNMDELGRIDQFVCSEADARDFADQSGLVSRDVAWLNPPKKRR